MSKGTTKPTGGEAGADNGAKDGEVKDGSTADLSLIYCFGKSVAVTRKIDPDVMVVLEQHVIFADRRLDYNRRTGKFYVPGPGRVYKYERSDESKKSPVGGIQAGDSNKNPDTVAGRSTVARRTVTPTSGRTVAGNTALATPPVSRKIPPLVLTQIFFTKGMEGQFGTSQENDTTQDRTAILFGDIQLRHGQVNSVDEAFDFDQPLTEEGFFLTSQILRLIQEPPLPGSPPSTPTRSFLKAWDDVTINKGQSMVIQSDVGTYDSGTDQLYAYGEGDRGVDMLQQEAVGQPASPAHGKAIQFNVKSGAADFVNSDVVQIFDKRTGARPGHVGTPDPNAKAKKRRGAPFMVPNNNLERRGFTGQ
jgi:hypothetical protein